MTYSPPRAKLDSLRHGSHTESCSRRLPTLSKLVDAALRAQVNDVMVLVVELSVPLGRDGVSPHTRPVDGAVIPCVEQAQHHALVTLKAKSDLIPEEQPSGRLISHETSGIQWLTRV